MTFASRSRVQEGVTAAGAPAQMTRSARTTSRSS